MPGIRLKNARLIGPSSIVRGEVLARDGVIAAVAWDGKGDWPADRVVDVADRYLSPGFVDIHTHGAGGFDFMDGSLEAVYGACLTHLRHGTTCLLPTTSASTRESLLEVAELFNHVEPRRSGYPEVFGLHMEGPYFAMEQRGAQDAKHLRNPDPEEYIQALRTGKRIVRWSFAIELEGGEEFLRTLREKGVIPSLAHSDATCQQVRQAYANGVHSLTHFYSGMSGLRRANSYRIAGAIEAGYLLDGMYVEVIADGKHLPADLLELIYKVKGPDRVCLVTDSMRAAGMPPGHYKLGNIVTGMDTVVEDSVAKLPDRLSFAGSVATADRLVRTMRDLSGATLPAAVAMMSLTPARLIGLDSRKGSIAVGKDADLVVFDEGIHIQLVMARGEIIPLD